MIEIFKTNVQQGIQADELIRLLLAGFPFLRINFDLEDCDKILRVEGDCFVPDEVIKLVRNSGFTCNILE